jgi:ribonuclease P protein component
VAAALGRLRKRSEFLAVASANRRSATPGLVLQAKARRDDEMSADEPTFRIGFTATKKIGNAVARNRARRRLRAAVREVLGQNEHQAAPVDLVLVARQGTIQRNYGDLKNDLAQSLKRLGVLG